MIGDIFEKGTLISARLNDETSFFILSDQYNTEPLADDTFAALATCLVRQFNEKTKIFA